MKSPVRSLQMQMDRLTTSVVVGLTGFLPRPEPAPMEASRQATSAALAERQEFPQRICEGGTCRDLAATGSRMWGSVWDGRGLLNMKIYDFALYVDSKRVRTSQFGRKYRKANPSRLPNDYYAALCRSSDFGMSLLVRTNHSLPIGLMAREYERILRRRIVRVGGDENDPELKNMITCFDEANLPSGIKSGPGKVRKGTVLTFHRTDGGGLSARVEGELLGEVPSRDVSAALFDLYLGDNPVSSRAKQAAGRHLLSLISLEDSKGPARLLG